MVANYGGMYFLGVCARRGTRRALCPNQNIVAGPDQTHSSGRLCARWKRWRQVRQKRSDYRGMAQTGGQPGGWHTEASWEPWESHRSLCVLICEIRLICTQPSSRAFYKGQVLARFQMRQTKKYWNMSVEVRPSQKDFLSLNLLAINRCLVWSFLAWGVCPNCFFTHNNHFYLESQDVRLPLTYWWDPGAARGAKLIWYYVCFHLLASH